MPLARGNVSPVRCAAKCSTTLRKRQHLRSLTVMARQHQFASVIERMQQEQQYLAAMTNRKRQRGDVVTDDDDDDATQGKKCKTTAEELGELKASVHHVQRQVATASRHIQELRALVYGFVEQRRTATQTAICA